MLCLMPFLGYAQTNASLAMQDDEEVFGQAPVSKELPAKILLNNMRGAKNDVWAHAMYVPSKGFTFGRYYEIRENGTTNQVTMYNDWYYSAAEYYSGNVVFEGYPVWAFAEDYVQGFSFINYDDGNINTNHTPITLNMCDITYDYHNSRMLGTKNGYIYEVNISAEEGELGAVIGTADGNDALYDPNEHDNLKPIAIACDLDGTLYFVSTSTDGVAPSSLYKFADGDLTQEPQFVGDLGWPARKTQTMAFNHKTRELFWFACDKDGNTQLKQLDKETGAILFEGEMLNTEISGLIFEFDYRPYNVTCINDEGTVLLDEDAEDDTHTFTLTSSDYYPGKDVEFYVKAENCYSIDSIVVANADDDGDIIAVFHVDDLVYVPTAEEIADGATMPTGYNNYTPGYYGSFVMPANDVVVDAFWIGNRHTITVTIETNANGNLADLTNAITTSPAGAAGCGETVTINYAHPAGYILTSLTATPIDGTLSTPNNYQVTFTMPDNDVEILAVYHTIVSRDIEDICQYHPLNNVPPQEPCTLTSPHTHEYFFRKPNAEANDFNSLTEADMLNGETFNEVGTWGYYATFINRYGTFEGTHKSFQVYAAPRDIVAIEGNQYNCVGDSIVLTAVFDPADAVLNGTFVWTRNDTVVATTTEPRWAKYDIVKQDAGTYNVTFNVDGAETTATPDEEEQHLCTFSLEEGYPVNVSSVPNKPDLRLVNSESPICFNSSVEVEWDHGVLNPDEYEFQWYVVETTDTGDTLVEIPGATSDVLETGDLKETTYFVLSLHYAGENSLCHSDSDPFPVMVKDSTWLVISGDLETCLGINPINNPHVEGDFSDFTWTFDNKDLSITGNELDFDLVYELDDFDFVKQPGTHKVTVSAVDATNCVIEGKFDFIVKDAPDITITNNITEDIAYYDDDPIVTINVCAGEFVELTAHGGTSYRWDPTSETTETVNVQVTEDVVYSVTGTDEETGCSIDTKINIHVKPLPTIEWKVPASDTTFSMITHDFQLQAKPAGGYFSYVQLDEEGNLVTDDEGHVQDYPIADGLFNPAELGLGDFLLIYSYEDEEHCNAEARINISIEKPYWTDEDNWDPEWFDYCTNVAHRFEITNPAQAGSFMAHVYGLNGVDKYDFAGDTVWITNNIDLQEKPVFYRPFCDTVAFNGTIDGTGKFITNMTILEDNLNMGVYGFVRNIGLKDANITSVGNPCIIYMAPGAVLHNGFITMPNLDNVNINYLTPEEVQNFYYYGENHWTNMYTNLINWDDWTDEGGNVCIYINTEETPRFYPTTAPVLLTKTMPKVYNGILEQWVWLTNDFNYRDWITDDPVDPAFRKNYGYPYMNTSFIHHHYVDLLDEDGCGTTDTVVMEGVSERTIKGKKYVYAMNDDEITVTFTPESDYVVYDSLVCTALGYNGEKDSTWTILGTEGSFSFTFHMPIDSIYLPAYSLEIQPYSRRSYWTDEATFTELGINDISAYWYDQCVGEGRFEIGSNIELAAFAWEVNENGRDFAGDTVFIKGAETANSFLLDMSGHYWKPIRNFNGVLNGTRYIVDNLYIDESCTDGVSAMFVDCNCSIINMGIQDYVLPEEGEVASYLYNTSNNYNATIINSFATTDPAAHLHYELAVGDGVTVTNTYTLDEGGAMIDHDHNGIGFAALRAWVAEHAVDNPRVWWDWKYDDAHINYDKPIHSEVFDGGWLITYIPSGSSTSGSDVHNFIGGPTYGHKDDVITVIPNIEWCYDMTSLTVLNYNNDGSSLDIDVTQSTYTFVMPDHPVTVYATFSPKNWHLTVNYLFVNEDGEEEVLAAPEEVNNMHNNDVIDIDYYISLRAKVITDYDPIPMDNDTMSCENKTVNIYYQGKEHNIITDQCEDLGYDLTIATDPDGTARYRETVTVTVTVEEGVSIAGLVITDANGNDIEETFTGTMWVYTFEMPNSDVTICAIPTEEYWDDYQIADPTWFFADPYATSYVIETDSMLGGLAALVTGRQWLLAHWEEYKTSTTPAGYELTEENLAALTFEGVTITLNSTQEENEINLIEHKWRPIGAQIEFNKQFQGTFNGNGHKITNMNTVDATHYNEQYNGACQALFGTVGINAIINDVNIQGRAEGRYFTAGVAAINYGLIMNCVADVNVYSEFQAGGIVCNNYNTGYILNSYCISEQVECYSADNTKDQDNPTNAYYVGGVAAYNEGIVNNCHSVATLVKGHGNNPKHYYGNIIGMNAGQADNCYWLEDSEFPGYGEKMGTSWSFEGCGFIGTTTSADMTAMATTLGESFENVPFPFFSWEDGDDDYPVFAVTSKAIMSVNGNEFNVVLYPNPTKDIVNISSDNIQRVTVFNMFGQMVLDAEVNSNETTINMNGFSAGVYMVRITTSMGVATRNIVVE